jgi:hypothetical protein
MRLALPVYLPYADIGIMVTGRAPSTASTVICQADLAVKPTQPKN